MALLHSHYPKSRHFHSGIHARAPPRGRMSKSVCERVDAVANNVQNEDITSVLWACDVMRLRREKLINENWLNIYLKICGCTGDDNVDTAALISSYIYILNLLLLLMLQCWWWLMMRIAREVDFFFWLNFNITIKITWTCFTGNNINLNSFFIRFIYFVFFLYFFLLLFININLKKKSFKNQCNTLPCSFHLDEFIC